MSDSRADSFAFTADNTISQYGIDVEKLNQAAAEVQTQLKTGFGDYCEKGSRGDIRHLQMPKFFNLLEEVHTLNTTLTRLQVANEREHIGASDNMTSRKGGEMPVGGKTKTLTAKMQAMQEQMEKLMVKNEELQQGLKTATADAKEARKQTESFKQETETQRKDITRLEKKTKELERKGQVAEAPRVDLTPLERQIGGLRADVEIAFTAAGSAQSAAASAQSVVETASKAQQAGHAAHDKAIEDLRHDFDQRIEEQESRGLRLTEYISYQSWHLSDLTANQVLIRNWTRDDCEARVADRLNVQNHRGLVLFHNSFGRPKGIVLLTFWTPVEAFFALRKRHKIATVEDIYYPPTAEEVPRGTTTILISGFRGDWSLLEMKEFLFQKVEIGKADDATCKVIMNFDSSGTFRGEVLVDLWDEEEVEKALSTLNGKVVGEGVLKIGVVRDTMCGFDDEDESDDGSGDERKWVWTSGRYELM